MLNADHGQLIQTGSSHHEFATDGATLLQRILGAAALNGLDNDSGLALALDVHDAVCVGADNHGAVYVGTVSACAIEDGGVAGVDESDTAHLADLSCNDGFAAVILAHILPQGVALQVELGVGMNDVDEKATFKGLGILLIAAALVAMAFSGFSGISFN